MIRCDHCGAETANGLALCALCQAYGASMLEYIPVHFRNLARWRPGRAGSRPVPGSRVLWEGERTERTDRVTRALDAASNALSTWARTLADDRPHMADALAPDGVDAEVVAALCETFGRHVTSIATTGWCGELLRDLAHHERALRALTEQVAPGWYAGACEGCEGGLYVVPGLTWVTCGGCGSSSYARDRLDVVLREARGWVARPKQLAAVIVALVDGEQSVRALCERIHKWHQRGLLTGHRNVDEDGDEVGPRSYRLGDVLDLTMARRVSPRREGMGA